VLVEAIPVGEWASVARDDLSSGVVQIQADEYDPPGLYDR